MSQIITFTEQHRREATKNVLTGRRGGVMVGVYAIRPKVCRFKPGRGDGFLREIKIHSMPSSGGEVKPEAPCHNILRHVKNHLQV
jgi:hypothetical protein